LTAHALAAEAEDMTSSAAPAASAARILLVDDDPIVLEVGARVLQRGGYVVAKAHDAHAALQLLEAQRFELIISDVQMPSMSGLELLQSVRDQNQEQPLVLLAGAQADDEVGRVLRYLPTEVLLKPVAPSELLDCVRASLRKAELAKLRQALLPSDGTRPYVSQKPPAMTTNVDAAGIYQPIVSWSKRKVFGYDAISGIHPVGVGEALLVTLHPRDLVDDTLATSSSALTLLAARVILQLSERAPLQDIDHLARRIARLRKLGFRIAMDHVGAGYSDFNRFVALKPDLLRLDVSLVRRLDVDPERRKQLRALIELCAHLEIDVVAAGIENVFERDRLFDLGCDLFQGTLFGRPGPAFPEARL
jgi:EAL domain-containing protein (putative c-di-GMP-specific phosphodiesterase class I)/ActR/RegA family two-component response regulator